MEADVRSRTELRTLLLGDVEDPGLPSSEAVVRLAERLLAVSLARETAAERAHKRRLARLLEEPQLALFGSALTDRGFRSSMAERSVEIASQLAGTVDLPAHSRGLDRLLVEGLLRIGPLVPDLTRRGLLARIAKEAEPFVQSAEPEKLGAFVDERRREGFSILLNYLGEEVLGEEEAERHALAYIPFLERSDLLALSVKLSGLTSRANPVSPSATVAQVLPRLRALARRNLATSAPKLLYFDMEAYRDLEATHDAFERLAFEFPALPLGIAIQAYLPESLASLDRVTRLARRRGAAGAPLHVRLVKGANLGMEQVLASRSGLVCPVFPDKAAVDAQYKRLLDRALSSALPNLRVGIASHNLFDVAHAVVEAERRPSVPIHFEMLAGMSGSLGRVLLGLGRPVLLYTPAVLPEHFSSAIAYLLRRLDESTAERNFLRRAPTMTVGDESFREEAEKYRASVIAARLPEVETRRTQSRAEGGASEVRSPSFSNAPDTDFTRIANRTELARILEEVRAEVPLVRCCIAGAFAHGPEREGYDPSRPGASAYRYSVGSPDDVERALADATRARERLRAMGAEARIELLERIADELERARFRLVATMVKDTGKRVLEADLEVSEAVDFARYYAREFRALKERYEATPLGVVTVTPPWNFPLAIPLGGIAAALVTGNAVIFKPAPEAILTGHELYRCLLSAGLEPSFVQFLVLDDEIASPLVFDERVAGVLLTGATETALRFLRRRPRLRLFAETGGKNCAFVSAEADREGAIQAIVQSAFGHAGQKCSALSVLVLEREVYESRSFREALVDAASSLVVGSAWELDSFVTPLIHPPRGPLAYALSTLEEGERFLLASKTSETNPRLVSPAIRVGVRARSRAHTEEFFGPHLALLPARDLDHGLSLMNSTRYGLTAGLFSLNEREQREFVARMNAGNLYVNRATTGAVVGRQPFGGRKASSFGPGGKAGGPNYLPQLCELVPKPRASGGPNPASALPPEGCPETFEEECRRVLEEELLGARLTTIIGERNELRYECADGALVVLEGARPEDVRDCLRAFRVARTTSREPVPKKLVVLVASGVRLALEAEFSDLAIAVDLTPARSREIERLRVLGRGSERFDELRATGVYVDARPERGSARSELGFFLREKSISTEAHRYGNLRLADLPRALGASR